MFYINYVKQNILIMIMNTDNKKYSFMKFINFIKSLDGDLNNASNNLIIDSLYDDTSDLNEKEFALSNLSDYEKFSQFITKSLHNTRLKCKIEMREDSYIDDIINMWITFDNLPSLVFSMNWYIYKKNIENWLALN